jgi:hypothetical protein
MPLRRRCDKSGGGKAAPRFFQESSFHGSGAGVSANMQGMPADPSHCAVAARDAGRMTGAVNHSRLLAQ